MKNETAKQRTSVPARQRQYRRPTLDKSVRIADITALDGKISGLGGA